MAILPAIRYWEIATRAVERGRAASVGEALSVYTGAIATFAGLGLLVMAVGVLLATGRKRALKRLVGGALIVLGVVAFIYGALQFAGAVDFIVSGKYRSTGYGLLGAIFLGFSFFAVPLLALGVALLAVGIGLIRRRNEEK